MIWLISAVASAAYGDAVDGYPTYDERVLHHWTNAARLDPEAHEPHYTAGGCSVDVFTDDERTGKPALRWDHNLTRAARFHTDDMADNDFFDHASSDGTDGLIRIAQYYGSSAVGENISQGYPDHRAAVLQGWMCSTDGHRGNIMDADWSELGTGVNGALRTQDFGGDPILPVSIAMGVHTPAIPSISVGFYADWYDAAGRPPERFEVVMNGIPHPMSLEWGEAGQGMYSWAGDLPLESCVMYHFEADIDGAMARFPYDGSYGWGDCDFDDPGAQWSDGQWRTDGGGDPVDEGCGCDAGRSPRVGWMLVLGLFGVTRRRWP